MERRHPTKIELGLSRVELVRQHLSLTLPMPIVLIAGTNGKGSICVFMEAILRAAGFRVGCYTSPHLLRFNERLRINGVMAADKDFVESFQRVEKARAATAVSLTYFEFTTLAAAEIIAAQNCDFALLEVGMGGRLDAVNVFPPAVSVVSGVGLDHCDYLGDTVEKIAVEKAGIFRNQRPAVIGQHDPPESLLVAARKVGALLRVTGDDFTVQESNGRCWNYQGHHRLSNLPIAQFARATPKEQCRLCNCRFGIFARRLLARCRRCSARLTNGVFAGARTGVSGTPNGGFGCRP